MKKRMKSPGRGVIVALIICTVLTLSTLVPARADEKAGAAADLRTAISRVAETNIPAVVHIEVTQTREWSGQALPFWNDPFFRYFFGNPRAPRGLDREMKGLGSGMIMDSEGHILTNNHVVGEASDIEVLLSDGSRYPAKVAGTDPKTDLAVIKIDAEGPLPYVAFGDSDTVKVGEWVVAIGHPRGLDHTVTQGIISAKHRRGITEPTGYQDFLQTDAAINPGNSGGPLLNLQGQVIGVNAAIASDSGGFQGIGFAIPSNMALHTARAIIAHGKVVRGWLGVRIQDLTPELAKSFDMEKAKGALIADVVKDGPGEKAGIERGDVVISFRGKEIPDAATLRNEVAVSPVGQDVALTVIRKGKKLELKVKVESQDTAFEAMSDSLRDRLGADFRFMGEEEARRYRLKKPQGIVISWLDPRGPLAQAGFELGDIILEINGRPLDSEQTAVDLTGSLTSGERVTLLAMDHRSGRTGYVQIILR